MLAYEQLKKQFFNQFLQRYMIN